jgi:dUTP pyrophosphatase
LWPYDKFIVKTDSMAANSIHFLHLPTCQQLVLHINIINRSNNPLPQYATSGSSGMDIRASLDAALILQPMERVLVPTGLSIELPENFEVQIRPRSGLAAKQGITCLNSPGTIDADYRGEIKVILINLSNEVQTIEPGDRIAQMVLQKVEKINWLPAEIINETNRGDGGFGHTGKH